MEPYDPIYNPNGTLNYTTRSITLILTNPDPDLDPDPTLLMLWYSVIRYYYFIV